MGGPSSEYEISIATGKKILSALDPTKYLVQPVIVTKERKWLIPPLRASFAVEAPNPSGLIRANSGTRTTEPIAAALVPHGEAQALHELQSGGVDVAFIAMHGEFGEDGTMQGLLEAVGIPYTGSGVLASALGMDKPRSRAVFQAAGLRVPDYFAFDRHEWKRDPRRVANDARQHFGLPLVTKPANRGSSVGVSIVHSAPNLESAIAEALAHSDTAMIERYIPGTEVTCGVLETEAGAIPLQPTQIIPQERAFFDHHSKYTPGATEEITPPRLPAETIRRIQETGLTAHQAVGARGMSRTDMILDDDGSLYVLEINTIPGMTEVSLLPQAAAAVGIPFPKLIERIIAAALRKRRTER